MSTFVEYHEVRVLRDSANTYGVKIPQAALDADQKVEELQRYLTELESTPEPTGNADAIIDYRLRQPERVRIARDLLRQAEYDQRSAYTKASPELFEGFAEVFAREAERFINACDVLDPERKAGTGYRMPAGLRDGFGGFNEGRIIDDSLGDTLAVANDAARNLDHLAMVRNILALGPEPDVKGALSMAHVAVGGRFRVAARYSFGDGGDHRNAANSWWSLVLMPGVTALRMQSPEDMRAELALAIGKPAPVKVNAVRLSRAEREARESVR